MKYDNLRLASTCHLKCETAKLFIVTNTGGSDLYVVAKDVSCARWIAHTANHIREVGNGSVFNVRDEWLAADEPYRSALRRALAAGYPGPITRVGDSAVIIENSHAGIVGGIFPPLSTAPS